MVTTTQTKSAAGQQGFTLVELAIVLVIVGLLIGGILKGQELIANTRVNSTVSQMKALDTAANTFQDSYGGKPGDLANAAARLPSCTGSCAGSSVGTAGNGQIDIAPEAAYANANGAGNYNEGTQFFFQLLAADLISGLTPGNQSTTVGVGALAAPVANNTYYRVGFAAVAGDVDGSNPISFSPGHYLTLTNLTAGTAMLAAAGNVGGLTAKQAEGMDRKMDDGAPNSGNVLGIGDAVGATTCISATGAAGIYNTALPGQNLCSLYVSVMK